MTEVTEQKTRNKWYLSYPVLFATWIIYPVSLVLSIIRMVGWKKQTTGYRIRGGIALGFRLLPIILIIFLVVDSIKWEKEFDRLLENGQYEEAQQIASSQYGKTSSTFYQYYFRICEASGDYEQADMMLQKYYDELDDKSSFNQKIRKYYEENDVNFSDEQKGNIAIIFAEVDNKILAKKTEEEAIAAAKKAEEEAIVAAKKAEKEAIAEREAIARIKKEEADKAAKLKELETWLDSNIKIAGEESVEDKEIKWLKSFSTDEFTNVWKQVVANNVQDYFGNYDLFEDYMWNALSMYKLTQDSEEEISYIREMTGKMSKLNDENDRLYKMYGCNICDLAYYTETFYISQRLETKYDDNLLGSIQKEIDSYKEYTTETSDWVAYDVDYFLGEAYPGDNYRVLSCNTKNPFTRTGAYNITYYDTGKTRELIDSKGFSLSVPVYQMISDEMMDDIYKYSNWGYDETQFALSEGIMFLLNETGVYDKVVTKDIDIDYDKLTGYYQGEVYELYVNDYMSDLNCALAGAIWMHDCTTGTEFGLDLVKVHNNLYFASSYMGNYYFKFEQGKVDIYENSVLVSSATLVESY